MVVFDIVVERVWLRAAQRKNGGGRGVKGVQTSLERRCLHTSCANTWQNCGVYTGVQTPLESRCLLGPTPGKMWCLHKCANSVLTSPQPLPRGGVVRQKRVPSGGGGPWPIWRQLEKCSLRSLGDAGQRSGHTRLVPTNPDRATWSCSPWVTRATHPKLS